MADKVSLKIMQCPTCGASLKTENSNQEITCVYCGNTIVPVKESKPESQTASVSAAVKMDGIKTSSSALAYLDEFFEEYDWELFSYGQNLSIYETDKLAKNLKVTSADDKNTWFVSFKALSVPLNKKLEGLKKLLEETVSEYKKDNLDAYSKFDAYKRVSASIALSKDEIFKNLEKYLSNAKKYGATEEEISAFSKEIDFLKENSGVAVYSDLSEIPQIKSFTVENNARIAEALAKDGIDAESEYQKAKSLISGMRYVEALNLLRTLKGYSDSKQLIEKIDKYFLISDILEVENTLYYYRKEKPEDLTFNLYPTTSEKILEKALVKNISKIITNYADILYYLDGSHKLKKFNLASKCEEKVLVKENKAFSKKLSEKSIYVYGRRVFLVTGASEDASAIFKKELVELDLASGTVKIVLDDISEIISLTGNKMLYKAKGDVTKILNIDTMTASSLGKKKVSIKGFFGNKVVYTQESPNKYNLNLYILPLEDNAQEQLIEQNIFTFCDLIKDKMFYYVGNASNKTLISINSDGTGRREWPLYISEVLFEQGGWLYFIRKAGYNSILCKSLLDGSKFKVIAKDIDRFVEIKNGYLYYIDDLSSLVKVRMDGSNYQKLCDDVETVLSVKEDKIVFVSIDGKITSEFPILTTKTIKSIYAIDFSGSGKIKLAYDIVSAKEYDENTVYFVGKDNITASYEPKNEIEALNAKTFDKLYSLDVTTNEIERILNVDMEEPKKRFPVFKLLVIIAVVALILGLIFSIFTPGGFPAIFFIIAGLSLVAAIVLKVLKKI